MNEDCPRWFLSTSLWFHQQFGGTKHDALSSAQNSTIAELSSILAGLFYQIADEFIVLWGGEGRSMSSKSKCITGTSVCLVALIIIMLQSTPPVVSEGQRKIVDDECKSDCCCISYLFIQNKKYFITGDLQFNVTLP